MSINWDDPPDIQLPQLRGEEKGLKGGGRGLLISVSQQCIVCETITRGFFCISLSFGEFFGGFL